MAAFAVLLAASVVKFFYKEDKPQAVAESPAPSPDVSALPEVRQHSLAPDSVASIAPAESTTNEVIATNLYARLANGDIPRVSREQLEPFLAKNHRSVDSLLGALRASGDSNLLNEAKEKFPGDPRVQFAAWFKGNSPEEKREWLDKFKQSAPDNALPDYLLAAEHFKAGDAAQALQEITAANAKPGFENYLLDFIQNAEEAYRAGGYSPAEAKGVANMSALLPELAQLKQVGVNLAELAKQYRQAGDEPSAQAALEMALNLAHRQDQTPQTTLIQELVGMAIERIAFNGMNPSAPYGQSGQTVQDQLDALAARRKAIRELTDQTGAILKTFSDEELTHYFDRERIYGEVAALHWVANQAPRP